MAMSNVKAFWNVDLELLTESEVSPWDPREFEVWELEDYAFVDAEAMSYMFEEDLIECGWRQL
jgi:hypothetical protein